ncbi:hypothetical protein ACFE04_009879 [Oxalis oulophora]
MISNDGGGDYICYIMISLLGFADDSVLKFENVSLVEIVVEGNEIGVDPRLVAGSFQGYLGHVDGKPSEARFNHPKGVTVDDNGNVYVAHIVNLAIRKIGAAELKPNVIRMALVAIIMEFRNAPKKVGGMLAGGTGIAPMFQSIFGYKAARAILENANGKTNINLIYANVTHSFEGKVSLL